MAEHGPHRGRAFLILKLARMHFLIPGFLLYLLGFLSGALRGGLADAGTFAFGYSIFWAAQLSVSFSNDYFDRKGDSKGRPSALSGGSGVLVEHGELSRLALGAALVLLLASMALAGAFTWVRSFPTAFFAYSVAGALVGWFYSAPPLRLSSKGLSEITVALSAGFIMPGMGYFVSYGAIDAWFMIMSLPVILFGAFFILTVEMPDMEADLAAKKRNFLTFHGRKAGMAASVLATAGGTTLLFAIAASGVLGSGVLFLVLGVFALIPFVGSVTGIFNPLSTGTEIYRQAKINMVSLMIFLLLADAYMLAFWA